MKKIKTISHLFGKSKYRAILIFAIFSLILELGVLISNFVISLEISQDALSINLSGRQRLLSQKMVKALLQIYVERQVGKDTKESLQELTLAYQRFDETLQGFHSGKMVINGNEHPVFLKAVKSDKAKRLVKQGIKLWKPYQEKLQPIVVTDKTFTTKMLENAIDYASQHNLKLLDIMNQLTSELEYTTSRKATKLQIIQTGGMVLVLLNFLILLFHSLRKLNQSDELLLQAHHEITALNQCIKAENLDLMAELEMTNQKLTQFLEAVPVGVVVLDASGKIFYVNQKVKEILGQSIIPGTTIEQLASFHRIQKVGTAQNYPYENLPIVQALTGKSAIVDDVEIRQPDKILSLELLGTPIFDQNGHITYAIGTLQNITARKQAEAERKNFTKELQCINQAYERFVPHEFLNLLDKQNIIDVELGDQVEKEMTILFADIRGFTSLSEEMTPQENFDFINAYLGKMEPVIRKYHGFIDKYIGDAIMALFPRNADDAIQAAIAMLKTLATYNQTRQQNDVPTISIGIGINTGQLMLGTIGNNNRMDGTVISDAVNLASRVEGLTNIYNTALLITEQTYVKLADPLQYHVRVIDAVIPKGKAQEITIYEIFDADSPNSVVLKQQTRDHFELGFVLYHSEEISDAKPLFEKVVAINQQDKAAQVYLKRCQRHAGTSR